MSGDNKHIDDFFREELDSHTEPITSEDIELFEETHKPKRRFLSPKYIKWLPYLSALSAAAAVGFVGKNILMKPEPPAPKAPQAVVQPAPKVSMPIPVLDTIAYLDSASVASTQLSRLSLVGKDDYQRDRQRAYIMLNGSYELFNGALSKNYQRSKSLSVPNKVLQKQSAPSFTATEMPNEVYENEFAKNGNSHLGKAPISVTALLGYEQGLRTDKTNFGVASVQLRYRVARRLYIGVQPGVKVGKASTLALPRRNVFSEPVEAVTVQENGVVIGTYDYHYLATYDSTVVSFSQSSNVWEVELPFFWEYEVTKGVSLFTGLKFTYGSMPTINRTENIYTVKSVDSLQEVPFVYPTPETAISLFEPNIQPNSDNLKGYSNPDYRVLRTGYMFGVRLEPVKRVSLNLSIHQNASDLSFIPNKALRKVYNAPQFRAAIGYRFSKR